MSDDIAIHCDGLKKTFHIGFMRKKVTAVQDATFDVHRGEVFGLVGHNGAGKTTTMKMLLGLIAPDAGSATLLGRSIGSAKSREGVGFLPGPPHFFERLKPAELLQYFGALSGLERRALKRQIPELIALVGLTDAQQKQLRKFSKGMLQRIGLAQALLGDPELIIMDEPMGGLDPAGRKDVRDIIFSLKERGKTVLFSSHILSDVEQTCDRIAIIIDGAVTDVGRISEITEAGSEHVEVVLRFPEDAAPEVNGLQGQAVPGGEVVYKLPSAERVEVFLRAALSAGAEVRSVDRHATSLEDVFLAQAAAQQEAK